MKNDTDNTVHNRKGRPSKFQQLQIERRLKPLFMRGLSPYSVAIETGYSKNTVKKYYGDFYQEIRDLEGPEFDQACKDRMISACLGIDEQLLKMEKMQKELEQKSQTDGTQYIQLYKLRISLANSISDLRIKKLNIANSPTSDEMLAALRKVNA
ncbi:MAG TPA: hypothetical protein VGR54_04100 [Nitrosopumilaceae archaeon]|nr:hypothetical protein [Nitrosopumilaceae archaeon]